MLLKMSLSGGVLILFIFFARLLSKNRLPKRLFMLLWMVALTRLILPVELPLDFGIALPAYHIVLSAYEDALPAYENVFNDNILPVGGAALSKQEEAENTSGMAGKRKREMLGDYQAGAITEALEEETVTETLETEAGGVSFLAVLWRIGVLTLSLAAVFMYMRELRKVRTAIPLSEEEAAYLRGLVQIPERVRMLVSDKTFTPLTCGIVYPKIVFPKVWRPENDRELKCVLIHESVHVRRADNFRKTIMLAALCIHWFNPAVWLMYVLFNRDIEFSCDERVILILGEKAKKEYAMALVNLAEKQRSWAHIFIGFGKNAVKERILAIMKFKKITVFGAVCAIALAGVSLTVFAKGSTGSADMRNTAFEEKFINQEEINRHMNRVAAESRYFPEYEKYGLSYDSDNGRLMYEGNIVGHFHDEMSAGVYTHIVDEAGTVSFIVVRDADNRIVGVQSEEIGDEDTDVEEDNRLLGPIR